MNMTNDLRRQIIDAIKADMPTFGSQKRKDLLDSLEKRAREIATAALPEDVRAIYRDPDLRDYVNHEYVYAHGCGYSLPSVSNNDYLKRSPLAVAILEDPTFNATYETYQHLLQTEEDIKRELRTHLATCKTLRAFTTRFPALAKYAPADTSRKPTANLPATTALMDSLKAAGLSVEEGV